MKIILTESQLTHKIIAYHSSPTRINEFNLDFVGKGNDDYGAGIYFSSDLQYNYGKYCHEVELSIKKVVPTQKKVSSSEIRKMIINSPELNDVYENFIKRWYDNEKLNKINAINNMVRIMSDDVNGIQQHLSVWIDLYRHSSKIWCRNMVKFFNYDGVIRKDFEDYGVTHYIIYNPQIIKINKIHESV